jgi:glutaredoxin
MHYELYTREDDVHSHKILHTLVERGIPFVEVRLAEEAAKDAETGHARPLPFVLRNQEMVGGFSDLIIHLRLPMQSTQRVLRAW